MAAHLRQVHEEEQRYGQASAIWMASQNGSRQVDRRAIFQRFSPIWVSERGGEHGRAGPRARDRGAPFLHRVHRLDAPDPERVVQEMEQREGEEHEPGGDAQPLQQAAAQERRRRGGRAETGIADMAAELRILRGSRQFTS